MRDEDLTKEVSEENVVPAKMDDNSKEIMKRAAKSKKLSNIEIAQLKEEFKNSEDFLPLIEQVDIGGDYNRVIFTDGNEALIYMDGEFFVVDTVDSTKEKKKKKKSEAKDLYLEYFIRYTLNPMIEKNKTPMQEKIVPIQEKVVDKKEKEVVENIQQVSKEVAAEVVQETELKPKPENTSRANIKSKLSKKEFMELSPEEKVRFIAGVQKNKEDEKIR